MAKYSFDEVKAKLSEIVKISGKPVELELYINDKKYMIIVYKNHCAFQKCGVIDSSIDGSVEIEFKTLDDLYNTETVDNILLKRDWNDIEDFYCYNSKFYSQ